jgi:hypothetical protein
MGCRCARSKAQLQETSGAVLWGSHAISDSLSRLLSQTFPRPAGSRPSTPTGPFKRSVTRTCCTGSRSSHRDRLARLARFNPDYLRSPNGAALARGLCREQRRPRRRKSLPVWISAATHFISKIDCRRRAAVAIERSLQLQSPENGNIRPLGPRLSDF